MIFSTNVQKIDFLLNYSIVRDYRIIKFYNFIFIKKILNIFF